MKTTWCAWNRLFSVRKLCEILSRFFVDLLTKTQKFKFDFTKELHVFGIYEQEFHFCAGWSWSFIMCNTLTHFKSQIMSFQFTSTCSSYARNRNIQMLLSFISNAQRIEKERMKIEKSCYFFPIGKNPKKLTKRFEEIFIVANVRCYACIVVFTASSLSITEMEGEEVVKDSLSNTLSKSNLDCWMWQLNRELTVTFNKFIFCSIYLELIGRFSIFL